MSSCSRLGSYQQCNKTRYTAARFYDWEYFSNVISQDMAQQCFKIGNSSAIYHDKLYVSNFSGMGSSQQCNTRYISAMF